MGNINQYFSRWEIKCSCCDMCAIDPKLMKVMVAVREEFGPVIIKRFPEDVQSHAACRCPKRNKEVGGSKTSYHMKGMAIDFHCTEEPDNEKIANWIDENCLHGEGGIGIYTSFIHVDTRNEMQRWRKT